MSKSPTSTKTAIKNKSTPPVPRTSTPTFVQVSPSDFINTSSKDYAIYTAQNRAIPSSCDGLKDGQRKMLWMMRNKSEKVKTISLSGAAIQEGIFLHGDVSASDTISRLAAPYLNNVCLFEGLGAFGTRVSPDGWGAPRYTYVKKSKAAEALLYTDLDIVPLKPNYDGSVMEPANFLPLIPLTLLNGVSGIAVGWSTEILPHALKDLVAATIAAIDHKPIPKLMPTYSYLNTSVRGLGDNAYEFTGAVTMDSTTSIKVTELPPDLTLEKFKVRLNAMEENGEIHTYVDRSTKLIDVEVRFKRGVIDGWTEQQAIDFLKLKSKTTQRIVVLDFNNSGIKQYDKAEELVQAFVEWRIKWFTTRYTKLRDGLIRELNFACGIQACLKGGLPKWLPTAQNKSDVSDQVRKLTAKINLEDDQIERIVSLPTYRWAKDAIEKVEGEIAELGEKIVEYETILADPKKIRNIYKAEVSALIK